MEKKHYVVQYRRYRNTNHWETVTREYDTYDEAEAVRQRMPAPNSHRVAESYTVTAVRYKAAKR